MLLIVMKQVLHDYSVVRLLKPITITLLVSQRELAVCHLSII